MTIKINDDSAVMEVEVGLENKQESKDTNKIISDRDKCQEGNRTEKWDRVMMVKYGSHF